MTPLNIRIEYRISIPNWFPYPLMTDINDNDIDICINYLYLWYIRHT